MAIDYPELKLVAIGAVGTARQVVEYDNEMNNRVAEIFVPYMNNYEIELIINTGEKLLNLKYPSSVKDKIIRYSCGLPSICHQLCLNICTGRGIYKTSKDKFYFKNEDFDNAIEKFVEEKSDTFKANFDRAVKVPNKSIRNVPKEIIRAALKVNKDEYSFEDIKYNIKYADIHISELETALNELCTF